MFQNLAKHSHILVSGPQRSGTRICSKMIVADTGHRHIDETDVRELFLGLSLADSDQDWNAISAKVVESIQGLVLQEQNIVLHCPPLMPWIHLLDDVFVVILRRSIQDIEKSKRRIGTKMKREELKFNKLGFTRYGKKKPGLTKTYESLASLQYNRWDEQKRSLDNYQEIEYESLVSHSLWIPANRRINFRWNQIR